MVKQFISISLSLLLLLSNTGIAYAQHFCGEFEMMSKITLGHEKLSCGMAEVTDSCDEAHESEEHSCCNNQYTEIDIDDTITQSTLAFQAVSIFDLVKRPLDGLSSEILILKKPIVYITYNPPPLLKDIPVLYETFLI